MSKEPLLFDLKIFPLSVLFDGRIFWDYVVFVKVNLFHFLLWWIRLDYTFENLFFSGSDIDEWINKVVK